MCGRYTIAADAKALEARFHAYVPPGLLAPSYNAAPAQGLPTILNANPYLITVSAWGFRPEWSDWRDVTPVVVYLQPAGNSNRPPIRYTLLLDSGVLCSLVVQEAPLIFKAIEK